MSTEEFKWAARCVVAAVAFLGAAYVGAKGGDGWGWLIFAGVLALPLYSYS